MCLARNPRLVYARITGYGQEGPYANAPGHDINYVALAGALDPLRRDDAAPAPPLNLLGDFGGGGMLLVVGILSALVERSQSGLGQVVDAAMVDGVSAMMASYHGFRAGGVFSTRRGANVLDSGAYFYDVYRCSDDRFIAVGAIEQKFFDELLARLGIDPSDMPPRRDPSRWQEGRERLQAVFGTRSRDEWVAVFAGSDACVAPVLSLEEAVDDPHMRARGTHVSVGGYMQAAPAPRFSRTPPGTPRPPRPAEGAAALKNWLSDAELAALPADLLE